ncbi:MAG: ATP synthase F1 subunit delta [Bacteroidia bacterium]|jgi:F-type H+-transporting ATPase subunit delta
MSDFRVASRYAKSLVDLAIEQNLLEVVCADMKLFKQTIEQNQSLENLLKSPVIKGDKKLAVITQIFASSFNKLTLSFISIIVRKQREMIFTSICDAVIAQYNEINKIATASVKTAVEASAEIQAEIKNFLQQQSGKNVELKMHVDPSLIGGVMIQMEDRLYDASISGSLRKAKQQLLNTYISK